MSEPRTVDQHYGDNLDPLPAEAEAKPEPAWLHLTIVEQIIAVLRHMVSTIPSAAGLAGILNNIERQHAQLRDIVMPPSPPPEPAPAELGPDHSAEAVPPAPPPATLPPGHPDAAPAA